VPAALAEAALQRQFGKEKVEQIARPSLGVDDFAFFARVCPAVYLRLGCHDPAGGYVHPLHSSRF
jgi:metal-dependent amidase/aminoacylase/carboxypeptidase family protein